MNFSEQEEADMVAALYKAQGGALHTVEYNERILQNRTNAGMSNNGKVGVSCRSRALEARQRMERYSNLIMRFTGE